MAYTPPNIIRIWEYDESDQEYYCVIIYDDKTVVSAVGRFAQGSSSKSASWRNFLQGEMNDLVKKSMGQKVFNEVIGVLNTKMQNKPLHLTPDTPL